MEACNYFFFNDFHIDFNAFFKVCSRLPKDDLKKYKTNASKTMNKLCLRRIQNPCFCISFKHFLEIF